MVGTGGGTAGSGTGGGLVGSGGSGGAATGGSGGTGAVGSGGHQGSGGAGSGGRQGTGGSGSGGRQGSGGSGSGGRQGTGGIAGSGGVVGGTGGSSCTPSAEQCNGRDDNCDTKVDEGCPRDQEALGTGSVSATSPLFGSVTLMRNLKLADICPNGQAIVGFTGNSGDGLDALGVKCGAVRVQEDRTSQPYQYSVAVGPGTTFSPVGGTSGAQNMIESLLLCGPNQIVVGVEVTHEPLGGTCPNNGCPSNTGYATGCPTVYGLKVACARFNITGTPGAFRLVQAAPPTLSERAGGYGRTSMRAVTNPFTCPSPTMLGGTTGAFGPWPPSCMFIAINALQFSCTSPTIPLR